MREQPLERPTPPVPERPSDRAHVAAGAACGALVALCLSLPGQAPTAALPPFVVHEAASTRVLDPKLPDAVAELRVELLPAAGLATVEWRLLQAGQVLGVVASATIDRANGPDTRHWDGRLAGSGTGPAWLAPGHYELEVEATEPTTGRTASRRMPVAIVRLGITEMAATARQDDAEWQMVYFRKGVLATPTYFVTPAVHEYRNVGDAGEVCELDRDDGSPRPAAPLHLATDSPPMEGSQYEDDSYNFPLCYRVGERPCLTVAFGQTCTVGDGHAIPARTSPIGAVVRCRLGSTIGPWMSGNGAIEAGGTATFYGPQLPMQAGAVDAALSWRFEWSDDHGLSWHAIPGALRTEHRFYTILQAPIFGGSAGTQYAGPWVEVVHYLQQWRRALAIDTATAAGVTDAVIRGFAGQTGGLPQAIEGVRYDAYPLGGDGGASHYYLTSHQVQLARLLDNHRNGVFVNCSDCAAATAAMLGMLGVPNVQMMRLGGMTLRAIRGIGAPTYTLSLWGTSYHGFSYHHVVTRTAGTSVCDACLWVDEDGNPNALPGAPGFNVDRPWNQVANGYEPLVATNAVSFYLQNLPGL